MVRLGKKLFEHSYQFTLVFLLSNEWIIPQTEKVLALGIKE